MKHYKDNSKRAQAVRYAFTCFLILQIITFLFQLHEAHLIHRILNDKPYMEMEVYVSDESIQLFEYAEYATAFATIITFILWMHRAHKNIASTNWNLMYAPPLSIWSWMIPFANLFLPFLIMKEMSNALLARIENGQLREKLKINRSIFGVWWSLFIIKNFIIRLNGSIIAGFESAGEYLQMVFWELTLNAYLIGCIIYTMYFLRKLFALEEKAFEPLEAIGLD